jgi:hypothetical protein
VAAWLAAIGWFAGPPVVALVSNIGKHWSGTAKRAASGVFSLVAAVGTYGVLHADELSAVRADDWTGLWLPLLGGVAVAWVTTKGSYDTMWTKNVSLIQGLSGTFQRKNPGE